MYTHSDKNIDEEYHSFKINYVYDEYVATPHLKEINSNGGLCSSAKLHGNKSPKHKKVIALRKNQHNFD